MNVHHLCSIHHVIQHECNRRRCMHGQQVILRGGEKQHQTNQWLDSLTGSWGATGGQITSKHQDQPKGKIRGGLSFTYSMYVVEIWQKSCCSWDRREDKSVEMWTGVWKVHMPLCWKRLLIDLFFGKTIRFKLLQTKRLLLIYWWVDFILKLWLNLQKLSNE